MSRPAPLRFLAFAIGGWIGFRLIVLAPDWREGPARDEALASAASSLRQARPSAAPAMALPEAILPAPRGALLVSATIPASGAGALAGSVRPAAADVWQVPPPLLIPQPLRIHSSNPALPQGTPAYLERRASTALPPPTGPGVTRWSRSAWLLLRPGHGAGLAPGGTLGGSQAGTRLTYRINGDLRRPLALSARLYVPVDRPEAAEAAVGVEWQPLAGVPVRVLAERRERIGREGRSDFALSLHGGGERRVLGGRVRVEAYGQAGIVGVAARDLFADGAVRASLRAGPAELGAGAWGGAQPGASRLDVGPQLSISARLGPVGVRASAEWRFRVAGDAAPGSGPALTISAGF